MTEETKRIIYQESGLMAERLIKALSSDAPVDEVDEPDAPGEPPDDDDAASDDLVFSPLLDPRNPPPMLMSNCFRTPWWRRDNAIDVLLQRSTEAYRNKVMYHILNGGYDDGTPGINESWSSQQRKNELLRKTRAWMEQHPGARLGPYLRPMGMGGGWAEHVMANGNIWRAVDEWSEIVGGDHRLIIGLDASQRHVITTEFAHALEQRGIVFIGEAHGKYDRSYATMGIERRDWNRYHKDGLLPPAVHDSPAARYLWYSGHTVNKDVPALNYSVAELLGVDGRDIVEMYARQGYAIMGSVERIQQWREVRRAMEHGR
jgi:hypothetical protein